MKIAQNYIINFGSGLCAMCIVVVAESISAPIIQLEVKTWPKIKTNMKWTWEWKKPYCPEVIMYSFEDLTLNILYAHVCVDRYTNESTDTCIHTYIVCIWCV